MFLHDRLDLIDYYWPYEFGDFPEYLYWIAYYKIYYSQEKKPLEKPIDKSSFATRLLIFQGVIDIGEFLLIREVRKRSHREKIKI
jgi:hypothetical protein